MDGQSGFVKNRLRRTHNELIKNPTQNSTQDTRWARLLLDLVALPQTDPASISAKVFGPELGHTSAAATALAVSAAGLATAFPALASTARATGVDMRPWATLLELPDLAISDTASPSDADIDGWARLLRRRAEDASDACDRAR
jgi:hypothetical protein